MRFVHASLLALAVAFSSSGIEPGAAGAAAESPASPSKKIPGLLLAAGPAKLCEYLQITRELSGASFSGPELVLSRGPRRRFDVLVGPRVGVDYAGEAAAWPLRFAVADCAAVTFRRRFLTPTASSGR